VSHVRSFGVVVLTLAVSVLAGACSRDSVEAAAPAYTAPAWFAQQAQDREQARAALQACLDGKGWKVTVNEFGGADEPFSDDAELTRYHADMVDCRASVGLSDQAPTQQQAEQAYHGMLDTAACLRAQGFQVSDAPSEQTWVEAFLAASSDTATAEGATEAGDGATSVSDVWEPYGELIAAAQDDQSQLERISATEKTCPQWWIE